MQQLFDKEHKKTKKYNTYNVPYSNDFRTKCKHIL